MGAYGAAIHAMCFEQSGLISPDGLKTFSHTARSAVCQGCANHCRLTVNTVFRMGSRFISGNQCQQGLGLKDSVSTLPEPL